jgi:hypothetical protein
VKINELRQKFAYEGPIIVFVDGNSTHVILRSQPFAGRIVSCSFDWLHTAVISRNRAIYAFSGFSRFCIKGRSKRKERKRRDGKSTEFSFLSIIA